MTTRRLCPTCNGPINRGPGQHAYCSDGCRPECSVDGCSKPVRGRGPYCSYHRQHGKVPLTQYVPWNERESVCIVCKINPTANGLRRYCSDACKRLALKASRPTEFNCDSCGAKVGLVERVASRRRRSDSKYCDDCANSGGGRRKRHHQRPDSYECVRCGDEVSLVEFAPVERYRKTVRRRRSDSVLCDACKRRPRWAVLSVRQLANRDGINCQICGHTVNLDLIGTHDDMRPSIDHVVPRAAGGSDDAENLQLAHLWCNRVKNQRARLDGAYGLGPARLLYVIEGR